MDRLRLAGYIPRPTPERIRDLAAMEYMSLSAEETAELGTLIDQLLGLLDALDDLPQPVLETRYPTRDKGARPLPEEDPCNAFIRRCRVEGAATGPLAGRTVALKDNIRLAGVPMTNASRVLEHFVPDTDAAVVERLLDAGAIITGKLNMDDFGFAGTSETSAFGVIRNPHNPEYSAGGSSGGCGAAVAAGQVDIALAVDQGGSGRIPAAWCGVVAIKATHGLVPSYGITYLDHTVDVICPTARRTADVAAALQVIAGDDPRDPQWVRGAIPAERYVDWLDRPVTGLRIGVLAEGLDRTCLEPEVEEAFHRAVATLEGMGATISTVSLPVWRHGQAIWNGFAAHGVPALIEAELEGYGRGGLCDLAWMEAFGNARRVASDRFPPMLKALMVMGKYLRRDQGSRSYGKAVNLRYGMRRALDGVFAGVDVVVTPTIPTTAVKLLDHRPTLAEMGARAAGMCQNTYPINVTGHPALSVPCGRGRHGLPIGLQLIGPYWSEGRLLGLAHAFEQQSGYDG